MRSNLFILFIMIGIGALGGCGQYGYSYKPISGQAFYDPVSADYREHSNIVDIVVDTRGRRLDYIRITKPDGTLVAPTGIDNPNFVSQPIGGTAVPIDGPERADGPTTAHFDRATMGPKPWKVQMNIRGLPNMLFRIG